MSPRTLTGPHFITTTPNLIHCAHCQRPLLAATVDGLDTHIDPTPLTPAGELTALLTGRPTYDLRGELLARRTAVRIRGGNRDLPVVAEHTCRPTQPAHIDHAHLEATAALLQRLTGGQVAAADPNQPPPF